MVPYSTGTPPTWEDHYFDKIKKLRRAHIIDRFNFSSGVYGDITFSTLDFFLKNLDFQAITLSTYVRVHFSVPQGPQKRIPVYKNLVLFERFKGILQVWLSSLAYIGTFHTSHSTYASSTQYLRRNPNLKIGFLCTIFLRI